MVELYKGDTLELMATMADDSVGLVVTDAPYGMDLRMNRRTVAPKFNKIANDSGADFTVFWVRS